MDLDTPVPSGPKTEATACRISRSSRQAEGQKVETAPREATRGTTPLPPGTEPKNRHLHPPALRPSSSVVIAAVAALSIWYLVRGEPLLVQGEVDATRLDLAARVDGRVAEIPSCAARTFCRRACWCGSTTRKRSPNEQALAARVVADAQLANINAGTRAEVIAARKAALERAQAAVILAQRPTTASASWPSMATPRLRGSTRRPMPCMKANAPWTRPNRLRAGGQRLHARRARDRRGERRQGVADIKAIHRSSTRWWSTRGGADNPDRLTMSRRSSAHGRICRRGLTLTLVDCDGHRARRPPSGRRSIDSFDVATALPTLAAAISRSSRV